VRVSASVVSSSRRRSWASVGFSNEVRGMEAVLSFSFRHVSTSLPPILSPLRIPYLEAYRASPTWNRASLAFPKQPETP
jgi:hypothetical protein